jgi:Cu2+-exporting ATPase/Cu+-exporting ATPase
MKDLNIPVTGLHCASCALLVQKTVEKLPGVESSEVNYGTEKMKLRYDEKSLSLDALEAAVKEAGYGLILPAEAPPPRPLAAAAATQPGLSAAQREASTASTAAIAATGATAQSAQEAAREAETARLRAKAQFSLPVALAVFFFMLWDAAGTVGWLPAALRFPLPMGFFNVALFALSTGILFWAGRQFLAGFARFLKNGAATMDTLVGIGTLIAWLWSSFLLFFPGAARALGLPTQSFFDVTIVVTAFVLSGKYLEARSKRRTGEAIKSLMRLQAKTAKVERDGATVELPIEQVTLGDIIMVGPGQAVPVDGAVVGGSSAVDESLITGESIPVEKSAGDEVTGGTLNGQGLLRVEARRLGEESFLAGIIRAVEEAQGSRAPVQALADKVAGVFVPTVLIIAGTVLAAWLAIGIPLLGLSQALAYGLTCAIAVLVVACPCALGLATPTAIVVGVGRGAKRGILVKDAEALQTLRSVNLVVFDKTGTLTAGKPRVERVWAAEGLNEAEALWRAASLERDAGHPLAKAVLDSFDEKYQEGLGKGLTEVQNLQAYPGKGIEAQLPGLGYRWLGNAAWATERGLAVPPEAGRWASEGFTVMALFSETSVEAILAARDPLKAEAKELILELRRSGREVALISGDNQFTAEKIGAEAGIGLVYGGVLPSGKAEKIQEIRAQGRVVAFVGDGVNDAPALAAADASIAMATGTDAAMQTASITVLGGNLERVGEAVTLSRKTFRTIGQNLFWAFAYNVIMIPLAAGIFFPFTGWLFSPALAGAAMALSSVTVVSNSLRLSGARLTGARLSGARLGAKRK